MCKGSITALNVIPAVVGATYGIGISDHGIGAFHPIGQTPADCVACVQDGTQMTLSNIPDDLQKAFSISDHEVATFHEHGDDTDDEIVFANGVEVSLRELGHRDIIAYVGVMDVTIPVAEVAGEFGTTRVLEDA